MRSNLRFFLASLWIASNVILIQGQFFSDYLPELLIDERNGTGKTWQQELSENAQKLGSIRRLTIERTGLKTLTASIMCQFLNLEMLSLSDNLIEDFAEDAFQSNKYLRIISVSRSPLKNLSSLFKAFENSPVKDHLHVLDLASNHIDHLETFPEMRNLEQLYLPGNLISKLDGNVFRNLKSLQYLSVVSNNISTIEPFSFSHMKDPSQRVTVLLNANSLTNLQDVMNAFQDAYIYKLDVSQNKIRYMVQLESRFQAQILVMNENMIENLGVLPLCKNNYALRELSLAFNRLTTIRSQNFASLNYPLKLSLAFNRIESVASVAGLDGTLITELDLSGNYLLNLTPFPRMDILTSLFLTYTHLSNLAPNLFDNLGNLTTIRLDSNKIQSIQPGVFKIKNNPHKLSIDLGRNLLTSFSQLMNGLVDAPIEALNLNANQFKTLEAVPPMPDLKNISLDYNQLGNLDSAYFQNAPNLEAISLRYNVIETISPAFLDSIKNVRFIDLEENKIQSVPELKYLNGSALNGITLGFSKAELRIDDHAFERKPGSSDVISPLGVNLFHSRVSSISPKAFCSNYSEHIRISNLLIDIDTFKLMNKCHLRQLRGSEYFNVEVAIIPGRNVSEQDVIEYCGCGYTRLLANKYSISLRGLCTSYPYVSCSENPLAIKDDCEQQNDFRCPLDPTPATTTTTTPTTSPQPSGLSTGVIAAIVIGSALLLIVAISLPFIFNRFK